MYHDDVMIVVPPYHGFGVSEELFAKAFGADYVYVVDLGVGKDTLEALVRCKEKLGRVVIIDHHTIRGDVESLIGDYFELVHDDVLPASMLTYFHFKRKRKGVENKLAEKYAVVGTFADVAEGFIEVWEILKRRFKPKYPSLFSRAPHSKYCGAVKISAVLNAPRRMFWHKGTLFVHEALDEIEDDFNMMLEGIMGTEKETEFPKWALVEHWKRLWNFNIGSIYRSIEWFDFKLDMGYVLGFVDSRWNVAGFMSSIGADNHKKPAITVNMGSPMGITISARKPRNREPWMNEVDLDRFFLEAEKYSGGKISGGGHPDAAGGGCSEDMDAKEILDVLHNAWLRTLGIEAVDRGWYNGSI